MSTTIGQLNNFCTRILNIFEIDEMFGTMLLRQCCSFRASVYYNRP